MVYNKRLGEVTGSDYKNCSIWRIESDRVKLSDSTVRYIKSKHVNIRESTVTEVECDTGTIVGSNINRLIVHDFVKSDRVKKLTLYNPAKSTYSCQYAFLMFEVKSIKFSGNNIIVDDITLENCRSVIAPNLSYGDGEIHNSTLEKVSAHTITVIDSTIDKINAKLLYKKNSNFGKTRVSKHIEL